MHGEREAEIQALLTLTLGGGELTFRRRIFFQILAHPVFKM